MVAVRQVLMSAGSLAACAACYGFAVWLLRDDRRWLAVALFVGCAGFAYGIVFWLHEVYVVDAWVVAPYALCVLLLGVAVVGGELFVPGHPVLVQPQRVVGWGSAGGMATLTAFRIIRDLYRWIRAGDAVPRRGGRTLSDSRPWPGADPVDRPAP